MESSKSLPPSSTPSSLGPGFVSINGRDFRCGLRVLSKKEAIEKNGGLPFYMADLKKILDTPIEKFNDEFKMNSVSNIKNIKRLAQNMLDLQRAMQENQITLENYSPKHATSAHQEDIVHQPIPQSAAAFFQCPPTNFKCGDIIQHASEVQKQFPGLHIALLNPANRTHMGGGAFVGANALEEIYFRCSNLCMEYIKHAWDVGGDKNDGYIYKAYSDSARPDYVKEMGVGESWFTPNIVFTHCPGPGGYINLEVPITVSMMGSTAKIYNSVDECRKDKDAEAILKREIRAQLEIAKMNKVDIPILTAFGCGAFNNDPLLVAKCYCDVLYGEGYAKNFHHIEFAIWQDPNPQMPQNFDPFKKAFEENYQAHLANHISLSPASVFVKFNTLEEAKQFYDDNRKFIPLVQEGKLFLDNPDSTRCYPQYAVRIPIKMQDSSEPYKNFCENNNKFNLPPLHVIPKEKPRDDVLKNILVNLIMDKYWDDKKPYDHGLFGKGFKPPDAVVKMRDLLDLPYEELLKACQKLASEALPKSSYPRHGNVTELYECLQVMDIIRARNLLDTIRTPPTPAITKGEKAVPRQIH